MPMAHTGTHAVSGRVCGILLPVEEVRALRLLCPADEAGPAEVCLLWNHVRAHSIHLARVAVVGCWAALLVGSSFLGSLLFIVLSTGILNRTWMGLILMAMPGCSLRQGCLWVSPHEVGLWVRTGNKIFGS